MSLELFAKHFRGFEKISIQIDGINFLLGDNSSGKSSILHLIDAVLRDDLTTVPRLNEDLGVSAYDYFSPLFPDKPIIIGIDNSNKKNKIKKLISLQKVMGKPPKTIRCSYLLHKALLTLKIDGDVLSRRTSRDIDGSLEELCALHESDNGFEVLDRKLPENAGLETPIAIMLTYGPSDLSKITDDDSTGIINLFTTGQLPSTSFVGPIRSLPEKYYSQTRRISPLGLHFASMWANISPKDAKSYFAQIGQFGRESGLFDKVRVEPISDTIEESPLLVHVTRNGHDYLLNQVGVGVSQVAPVLTEAIFASASKGRKIALFQQPELHLHPVAQAALGSFFAKLASNGLVAFLETHSNYLIDRFRVDHKNAKKRAPKARVLFCTSESGFNSLVSCEIDKNGQLVGAPSSYYDFFLNESVRTML